MDIDISVVIPFYGNCRYRYRNLKNLVNLFNDVGIVPNVFEQYDKESKPVQVTGSKHIKIHTTKKHFSKNWLVNTSLNFVNSEYIWVCDADYCTDLKQVIKYVEQNVNDTSVIRPFTIGKFLTEYETQRYIASNNLHGVTTIRPGDKIIKLYGALSYIISRKILNELGGMDQQYEGWGYEDYDLYTRVFKKYKILYPNEITAVHLWHPESINKHQTGYTNRNIFNKKGFNVTDINNSLNQNLII